MIVSVTVLGARGKSQEAIADDVVGYLEKGRTKAPAGRRPGSVIDLPSQPGAPSPTTRTRPDSGPAAGCSGDRRGRPERARRRCSRGDDPATGARLLSGSGHAERAPNMPGSAKSVPIRARSGTRVGGGGAPRRERQLRAAALSNGRHLGITRRRLAGIERTADGRGWQIHRDALARLEAQRKPKRIVVGYDLTYSAPKSVSVLWAGADDTAKAAVLEAFDEAVAAGTRYFERHALVVRSRGEQQRAEGVFAADYFHATNRALEPQLHHHVVVANYGRGANGEGRALDARMLFLHAKTAGYLAAAELRHQLTARLGVRWGEIVNGIAEIEGVPESRAR